MKPSVKQLARDFWKQAYLESLSELPVWSRQIVSRIASHPTFQKAEKVALFYPREWEVNLLPLWEKRAAHCFFPKTDPKTWSMSFYSVDDLKALEISVGLGSLREPRAMADRKSESWAPTDLVLVPGLAFDLKGGRVGSGKGVYDRFFHSAGSAAQKWGVAFSPQVVSAPLPLEAHDVSLDALVTEKGLIYF